MYPNILFEKLSSGLKSSGIKKRKLKMSILTELYNNGNKSIPELSKYIHLSTPTITRAIDELISEGFLIDYGIGSSTGGRRPNLFGLNPDAVYVLGIDISRYYVNLAFFNFLNEIVGSVKILSEGLDTVEDILDFLKNEVREFIGESGIDKQKLIGVGIALPGLINQRTGISHSYLHDDEPVNKQFEDVFGYPVFVDNDTNVMALGELKFGLAKSKQNVLCLNIGSGVGLGLILNGSIYKGTSGYSGEFGHIQVEANGQLCHCGKIGCLETKTSGKFLIKDVKEAIKNGAITNISDKISDDLNLITVDAIIRSAQEGDQFAIEKLSYSASYLGQGIATLIHLFNPELIIIGGEMAKAENYIIDPIQQNLNKYAITRIRRDAQLVSSRLGDKAGLMGTVALVMENIFGK